MHPALITAAVQMLATGSTAGLPRRKQGEEPSRRTHEEANALADNASMDAAAACLDVVCDRLQKALRGRAIQHAQHASVCLCCKELEDGEHAARADVLAVQEAQRIRNGIPVSAKSHEKAMP